MTAEPRHQPDPGQASSAADIVVLIGNPRAGSRTRGVGEAVAKAILDLRGTASDAVQVIELAEVVGVSFGPEPAYGASADPDPFAAVRSARLLVVATPAYKGSYTGLLKIFLDQFAHRQLADVTAVPVAIAASPAHAEATAAALRDVLVELGARIPAPPLSVLEARLGDVPEIVAHWAEQYADALLPADGGPLPPADGGDPVAVVAADGRAGHR